MPDWAGVLDVLGAEANIEQDRRTQQNTHLDLVGG